jgi:hypothetical protein
MSRRAVAWLAWFLAGTSLALGLAGAVFGVLNGYSPIELAREVAVGVIMAVTFPLVGALVASRRPGNSLGWIFCVIGLAEGLVTAGWEYGTYALRTRPGSVPGGPLASFCGPVAVAAWPLRGPALLDPAGEGPSLPPLVEALAGVAFPLLVVCGILSVLSLVVRFRRSRAVERQQLKWFVYAAAVTLSGVLITEALPIPEGLVLDSLLAVAGLAVVPSVPVAAGVAILRYRLDEIDRIVNRTLVYAALTALLAGVYAAGALGLPHLLSLGESQLLVAASTLAVAACSARPAAGSSRRSTAASTGPVTTPPGRSRPSAPGFGTRSSSTACRPTFWPWSTTPSSRPRHRSGCAPGNGRCPPAADPAVG